MNRDDEESLGFFAEFTPSTSLRTGLSGGEILPLNGACPEHYKILRSAQDDMEGRAQNDKGMLLNNLQAVPQLREARQPGTKPEAI